MSGRASFPLGAIAAAALLSCIALARADVKLVSSIVATNSRGIGGGTVQSITYLKGPWLRREAAGEGRIVDILADKIIILNRDTGERLSLYVGKKVYRVDTLSPVFCGPEWVADMRMLGQSQSPTPANVSFPDTTLEVLGFPTNLVQIEIAPPGLPNRPGTLLRFWMSSDYAQVFGAKYRADLFCGDEGKGGSDREDFAAAWQKQFSLSPEATEAIRAKARGYPLKMEILSGNAGGVKTSTVIEVVSIDHAPLPDSLFMPPADYQPYEGKAEELYELMKNSLEKDAGGKK